MATTDEAPVHHRRIVHLQPLSPRVPSSTDRHFEQYLIDHHHYPKLPSIFKHPSRQSLDNKDLSLSYQSNIPTDYDYHSGSISRLLNSEQYRRSHARLLEYRQHSKIPGVALRTNNLNEMPFTDKTDLKLPIKEVVMEPIKPKQHHQNHDEIDIADDDSVLSNQTDRRRRAKNWIKEHQFFFTEYQ